MNGYRPYDEYEPNEPERREAGAAGRGAPPERSFSGYRPAGETRRREWTAEAWERPVPPDSAYAQRTWDEEDYLPNEPPPADEPARDTAPAENGGRRRRAGGEENPYARPTWDETAYPLRPSATDAAAEHAAYGGESRAASLRFDADADTSPNPVYAAGNGSEAGPNVKNPYARPESGAEGDISERSERYAPPLKFELPGDLYAEEERAVREEAPLMPNVYRTRQAADAGLQDINGPHGRDYRVEADRSVPASGERKRHALRRWLVALLVLAVLGGLAYLERGWVVEQLKLLFGEEAVETVQQAVGAEPTAAGFDAAPALTVGDRARKGINAVAGGIGLETVAVTDTNVVERVSTGEGTYDYYLFASADGKLLGYYDGLPADGLLVCPDDIFYVAMPPYLIDKDGKALLNTERYAQNVGSDPVLGPVVNGWALLCDAELTTFNYVNTEGRALSPLWFAKAYPFTADATVAYVDTGNVTDPEERYALYVLADDGSMSLWKHTADMADVLGCACGTVCMSDGELLLLNEDRTLLCTADDVSAYADCGAVVARDAATGKYGLFVNGEQQYDFEYDAITPAPADESLWRGEADGIYKLYTVAGVRYPLPLSHYFQFTKGGERETVALATSSVYPLGLSVQK